MRQSNYQLLSRLHLGEVVSLKTQILKQENSVDWYLQGKCAGEMDTAHILCRDKAWFYHSGHKLCGVLVHDVKVSVWWCMNVVGLFPSTPLPHTINSHSYISHI